MFFFISTSFNYLFFFRFSSSSFFFLEWMSSLEARSNSVRNRLVEPAASVFTWLSPLGIVANIPSSGWLFDFIRSSLFPPLTFVLFLLGVSLLVVVRYLLLDSSSKSSQHVFSFILWIPSLVGRSLLSSNLWYLGQSRSCCSRLPSLNLHNRLLRQRRMRPL